MIGVYKIPLYSHLLWWKCNIFIIKVYSTLRINIFREFITKEKTLSLCVLCSDRGTVDFCFFKYLSFMEFKRLHNNLKTSAYNFCESLILDKSYFSHFQDNMLNILGILISCGVVFIHNNNCLCNKTNEGQCLFI